MLLLTLKLKLFTTLSIVRLQLGRLSTVSLTVKLKFTTGVVKFVPLGADNAMPGGFKSTVNVLLLVAHAELPSISYPRQFHV